MSDTDKKTVATLLFSILVTVTGVGIVVPLLPIYAHDLGASGFFIGLIFGAFALSRTLFMPLFGRMSDTRGRKNFIVTGLALYSVISVAYVFSRGVTSLVVIRFLHGVASAMLMPVIQAYVGDITPKGKEGRMMGLFSAFVLFGLSLGPIIGGFIKDALGLRFSFLCMGLLAVIGFLATLRFLPPGASEAHVLAGRQPRAWRSLMRDRILASLFTFRFSYVIGIGVIWGFLPLHADLTLATSASSVGALIALGVFVSGVLNGPMGMLADRINKKLLVVLGGFLAAYAVLSLEWAYTYRAMLIATLLFGIGGGTCMPALMAMATQRGSKSEAMGSTMALMTVAHSLGMMAGALIGGATMDLLRLEFAFRVGAAVIAAGTLVFIFGTIEPIDTLSR